MKNLYEPGQFTVTAAMVVYLVKETVSQASVSQGGGRRSQAAPLHGSENGEALASRFALRRAAVLSGWESATHLDSFCGSSMYSPFALVVPLFAAVFTTIWRHANRSVHILIRPPFQISVGRATSSFRIF